MRKTFRCTECNRYFSNKTGLRTHFHVDLSEGIGQVLGVRVIMPDDSVIDLGQPQSKETVEALWVHIRRGRR